MKAFILALLVAAATALPVSQHDSGPVEVVVNGVPKGHGLDVDNIVRIDVQKKIDGDIVAVDNLLHPFSTAGIIEAAIAAEENKPVVPDPVIVQPDPVIIPEIVPEPVILPEPVKPEVVPEPVILPEPVKPEVVPEPVILPEPVKPEVVPDPVILPEPIQPETVPEPVLLPEPIQPETVPEPVVLPEPVQPEIIPEPVVLPPSPGPEVVGPVHPDIIVLPDVITPAEVLPAPSGVIYNDGVVDVTVNAPSDYNIMGTLKSWFNVIVNYLANGTQQESVKDVL